MATVFYGTTNGFKAYCTERGIVPASNDDAAIQSGLIVSSEWIDAVYRSLFPGLKVGQREQQREWPREGAIDIYGNAIAPDSVPIEIEYATYEATLRQLAKPGCLSVDYTPPKYKSAAVTGAVAVVYAQFGSAREIQQQFAKIDEILSGILIRSSDSSGLVGSICRV